MKPNKETFGPDDTQEAQKILEFALDHEWGRGAYRIKHVVFVYHPTHGSRHLFTDMQTLRTWAGY